MSCHIGSSDGESKTETTDAKNTVDELIGNWERRTSEVHNTLYIMKDGKGKLVSYGQATSTTEKFDYTVTDNYVVVKWNTLTKEKYHAVLTVDGKYLVLDNGSSVFVYKKRGK